MPGIWSPEHLLVASISSCLMTTFLAIADNSKLLFSHFSCRADGKLESVDGKLMMSEVTLMPVVTLLQEQDRDRALRILQKAEANCLITNSVKAKIKLVPEIKVFPAVDFAA
jgi:organic hydroperoxide reductase OsmC/OhrA